MRHLRILLPFIVLALAQPAKSQHKILMINGREIQAESYSVGDMFVSYRKISDRKSGMRAVDRYDVFSITDSTGKEQVLYVPIDSLDLSIAEARNYIKGEQAAYQYYTCKGVNISSALVGAGSSFLSFYALPVPMVYSLILGRFNPKNYHLPENFDRELAKDEGFMLGYEKAARNLKIQRSLKWGYIGLGVGLTTLIIYGITAD